MPMVNEGREEESRDVESFKSKYGLCNGRVLLAWLGHGTPSKSVLLHHPYITPPPLRFGIAKTLVVYIHSQSRHLSIIEASQRPSCSFRPCIKIPQSTESMSILSPLQRSGRRENRSVHPRIIDCEVISTLDC